MTPAQLDAAYRAQIEAHGRDAERSFNSEARHFVMSSFGVTTRYSSRSRPVRIFSSDRVQITMRSISSTLIVSAVRS